jgi:hypothetical protein
VKSYAHREIHIEDWLEAQPNGELRWVDWMTANPRPAEKTTRGAKPSLGLQIAQAAATMGQQHDRQGIAS